jgi:MurNAc alpha-1-phosphate uridylyltransferase
MAPQTAMVLAAGLGSRMRPLSATTPKPLIEVGGRALIDLCLDGLAAAGVERAVVNLHYLADQVASHLASRRRPAIVTSDERDELLDTGGGIVKALPLLGSEPFLLRNADSFWLEGVRPNIEWLAGSWSAERMDAVLLVAPTVNSIGYSGRGDFLLDNEGRLRRRPERTVAPFVYAGAAILHPRLFADAPAGAFSLNLLFDRAIAAGALFGVRLEGLWFNVETPSALTAANAAMAAIAH